MRQNRILTLGMYFAVCMVIEFGCALSALAQAVAERTMSLQGYTPDVPINVSIKVIRNKPVPVVVAEKPPAGWAINNVLLIKSTSVTEDAITWNMPSISGTRILSYTVTPPGDAFGNAIFSGMVDDQEIGGVTTMVRINPEPLGVFQNHIDFGFVTSATTEYNPNNDIYSIYAGYTPVFPNGHFIYTKAYGDCSIEAQCQVESSNDDLAYHSANLVVFNSLDPKSYYCVVMEKKANGDCWIGEAGSTIEPHGDPISGRTFTEGRMRLERHRDSFDCYSFNPAIQQWVYFGNRPIAFKDPVYIGLYAVCAVGSYTLATFSDVKLVVQPTTSAIQNWEIYQ
jgi:hypothetical protein